MNDTAASDGWQIGDLRRESRRPRAELLGVGAAGHTLFVPTPTGYEVVEADGPAPEHGATIVIGATAYRASVRRRSPFPGDARPCVVVEPI